MAVQLEWCRHVWQKMGANIWLFSPLHVQEVGMLHTKAVIDLLVRNAFPCYTPVLILLFFCV